MMAISIISSFVSRLEIDWLEDAANNLTSFLKDVVKDLSDNDLNNAEQIKARVSQHSPNFIDNNFKGVELLIEKVDDPSLRVAAKGFIDPVKDILKVSLDENPDNKAQLKAIVDKYKVEKVDLLFDTIADVIEKKDDSMMGQIIAEYLRNQDPGDFFKDEQLPNELQ